MEIGWRFYYEIAKQQSEWRFYYGIAKQQSDPH